MQMYYPQIKLWIYSSLLIAVILLISSSCQTNTELVPRNMALKYNPVQTELQPEIKVYQVSEENTRIFLKVFTSDMLFAADSLGNQTARYEVKIRFFKNLNLTNLLDSVEKTLVFPQDSGIWFYQAEFLLKSPEDKSFYIQMDIRDLNKNSRSEYFREMQKDAFWSDDDFVVKNASGNEILYLPILHAGEKYSVHSDYFQPEKALLFYIQADIPLAYPPFYGKMIPDLQFKAKNYRVLTKSDDFSFVADKPGIYHLQPDSTKKEGLSLYVFNEFYPEIRRPLEMAHSLRYLTSKQEFAKIMNSPNLKIAVDSFWLSRSSDMQQAASLIREYYSRVEKANRYFTSFTEGWRTDKGMIYTLLGPPTNVFIYKDREVWRYGARLSLKYDEFIFWKIDNPFSDNHYLLERKINYKPIWYEAVEAWRKGEIYRYTN